jgi:hypothetical protein
MQFTAGYFFARSVRLAMSWIELCRIHDGDAVPPRAAKGQEDAVMIRPIGYK